MFTMLFPIRIVEMSLSYFSDTARVRSALLSPFSIIVLSLVLLSDKNAVSVAEKYAENSTHTTMIIRYGTLIILNKFFSCIKPRRCPPIVLRPFPRDSRPRIFNVFRVSHTEQNMPKNLQISAQNAKKTQKGIPAPKIVPQIRRIYTFIIVVKVCSIVLATVSVHFLKYFSFLK